LPDRGGRLKPLPGLVFLVEIEVADLGADESADQPAIVRI
jgi:hypothetical protein